MYMVKSSWVFIMLPARLMLVMASVLLTSFARSAVFHSEWRAKDGRKAAILVNWTRKEQQYELDFEGVKRTGTLAPPSWKAESL